MILLQYVSGVYRQTESEVRIVKKNTHSESVNQLFAAILSLQNQDECYEFFEDICTINELLSLAQRFDVGVRLLKKQTYQEIARNTGASTATISRVNRLLGDANNGIEMASARLSEQAAATNQSDPETPAGTE